MTANAEARVELPRVLDIDLDRWRSGAPAGADAPGVARWRGRTPGLDRLGSWGGGALALALLYETDLETPDGPAPLVIAAGECVRRGFPTAARASIASRAPLTGLYADGQVGSDLGRRLASVADAVVLRGRAPRAGAVLHVAEGGAVELFFLPDLCGLEPERVHEALQSKLGACAVLCIGRAGEIGLPFASLAAGSGPPRLVGRGGLGAVMGRLGLKAVAISAAPIPSADSDTGVSAECDAVRRLHAALLSSPRLEARGQGGTLELLSAFRARGDLRRQNYAGTTPASVADEVEEDIRRRKVNRHGCSGCPTPCGWVFRTADGGTQGAHFSATYALGFNLGLDDFGSALELLRACDSAAMDAREVGAVLALACRAQELGKLSGRTGWGDLQRLRRWIADMLERRGDGELMARGARAMARELGLEDEHHSVKGEAARPESNLPSLLGQCVSARGADPMRTFPFLAGEGPDGERLRELLAPIPLPPGTNDPHSPRGKGRLVWWHENLMAAIDMTGFCAFSAGALLSDSVADVAQLADWIAPGAMRAGLPPAGSEGVLAERFLHAGEAIATLQRELNRRWGAPYDQDRPAWARDALDQPGMLAEYHRLRGVAGNGYPSPDALERFERGEGIDVSRVLAPVGGDGESAAEPQREMEGRATSRPGSVVLRCSGPLSDLFGRETQVDLTLPADLARVIEELARRDPRSRAWLLRGDRPLAAAYRAGVRIGEDAWIQDGDRLDLIVAISGG